jgi:hypothetical protein
MSVFRSGSSSGSLVRVFDIIALGGLMIYLLTSFFQKSDTDKQNIVKSYYDDLKDYMNDPISLFSIIFFIVVLYTIIFLLGIPMEQGAKPMIVVLLESGAWILFVLVLISSFFKYVLGISLTDLMDKALGYLQDNATKAEVKGNVKTTGNTVASSNTVKIQANEVFNISNNMYTYDDAQSVCKSMGARLATYDEVEQSYENGAEWCNYGWSENQSAYFPTQKSTWNELQKTKDQKNACGRPGINGGYMANPNLRLGINCFGKKPKPRDSDFAMFNARKEAPIPKSADDVIMEKKVQFWKDNADKIIQINTFNKDKWSSY